MNNLRVSLYFVIVGLGVTIGASGTGGFGWWWLAGILFATAFAPVALFGPRGWFAQFGVIVPVFMMVTVLCLWSEALIFVPVFQQHAVGILVAPAVMYAILAAVLAALAVILK